jgi:hypothetical protein
VLGSGGHPTDRHDDLGDPPRRLTDAEEKPANRAGQQGDNDRELDLDG